MNYHKEVYWYPTLHEHHQNKLIPKSAAHNPGFQFATKHATNGPEMLQRFVCLQMDDVESIRNAVFIIIKEKFSNKLAFNQWKGLCDMKKKCNNVNIHIRKWHLSMSSANHVSCLSTLSIFIATKNGFIVQQAEETCIATVYWPDLSFPFTSCLQVASVDTTAVWKLNNIIQKIIDTNFLASVISNWTLAPSLFQHSLLQTFSRIYTGRHRSAFWYFLQTVLNFTK